MKNFLFLLILSGIVSGNAFSQKTIILKPGSADGKDARIHSSISTYTSGNSKEFIACGWSWSGTPGVYRSMVQFDLSGIPANATVTNATIYLYANPNSSSSPHSMLSGSNACWLQRITSDWSESTITWANQPSTTTQNQVTIEETSDQNKNFDLDVTDLVLDMIANPSQSYGFLFRLKDENYYRSMNFVSSDHSDSTKWPELEITYTLPITADTCLILVPDATSGKDARIHSSISTYTSGNSNEFIACGWTWSGTSGVYRSLIDFDYSMVPINAEIIAATLYLYANPNSSSSPHSNLSGSNDCYLQRVNSNWDESTVTWATQPSVTTQNQVVVPGTNNVNKNYMVDVTTLFKDMFVNPSQCFGLLFRLIDENYYRSMNFASSDHTNQNLHPRFEICFNYPVSINETDNSTDLLVYPNPVKDFVSIKLPDQGTKHLELVDLNGKTLISFQTQHNFTIIDLNNQFKGIYFLKVTTLDRTYIEKVIKQ